MFVQAEQRYERAADVVVGDSGGREQEFHAILSQHIVVIGRPAAFARRRLVTQHRDAAIERLRFYQM